MNPIRISLTLALLAVCANVSAEDIKPGLWKISLESRVAASPDWQPKPFELTQCLTENDARNPDRLLAGLGGQGVSGCDFLNRDYSGSHVRFDLSCAGSLGLTGHGEMDFSATSLNGVLDVTSGGAEKIAMQNKLHAVYLGSCAGSSAAPAATGEPMLPAPPAE
jgi:hypothetical protein